MNPHLDIAKVPDRTALLNWIAGNNIKYDYASEGFIQNGKRLDTDRLFARAMLEIRVRTGEDSEGNPKYRAPKENMIKHALTLWQGDEAEKVIELTRTSIAHAAHYDADALLGVFVRAISPPNKTVASIRNDVLALKHFMWQVKRKLHGLPVEHHLMPVLWGRTGSGKTTAIKSLLAPVAPLWSLLNAMDDLGDSRAARIVGRNYVLFADEMEQKSDKSTDSIKRTITGDFITYRVLGAHKITRQDNNATLIGAANRPVKDIINDPTSARRFWDISCADRVDRTAVNTLVYLDLWRSIDEQTDSPWKAAEGLLSQEQHNTMRSKSSIEEFCDEHTEPAPAAEGAVVGVAELYTAYKAWCDWQGIRAASLRVFGPEVKSRFGFKLVHNKRVLTNVRKINVDEFAAFFRTPR